MTATSPRSKGNILKAAIWLVDRGYSVIPVRPSNKKPFIRWKEYQSRKPTAEELKGWWNQYPDANLAVVTGKISGITVVDVDSEEAKENLEENFLPDTLETPICKSPHGWHFYFDHVPSLPNCSRVLEQFDIRNDGGYIIVPPSMNGGGNGYAWVGDSKLTQVAVQVMPSILLDALEQYTSSYSFINKPSLDTRIGTPPPSDAPSVTKAQHQRNKAQHLSLKEGSRDESLFHVANSLVKGGMEADNIQYILEILARNCEPAFPESEVKEKVKSAINRVERGGKGLTEEIREWVKAQHKGNISATLCYNELEIVTKRNKSKARVIFSRLVEEGILERDARRAGHFRIVDDELEFQDVSNATVDPLELWLPLGLHQIARIYPGNIIAIAGAPNAGKTAFLLATARYNFKQYRTRYISSEMGPQEARMRIEEFTDISVSEWQKHWEFAERYDDYGDALLKGPGNLNIIDYIESPMSEAWRAVDHLADIHKKLNGAIAVVALQKERSTERDTGVGGDQTLAKPRLYIAMNYGQAKIVKCKSWHKDKGNPNWQTCKFKLHSGGVFALQGTGWQHGH